MRTPASPEFPTHPFEGPLSIQVRDPLIRSVISVAVQFDGKPTVTHAFDNKVNAISPDRDLWAESVAELHQSLTHLALKEGFTQFEHIG